MTECRESDGHTEEFSGKPSPSSLSFFDCGRGQKADDAGDTAARLKALEERMDRIETLLRFNLGRVGVGAMQNGATAPPVQGSELASTDLLLVRWSASRTKCEYSECYRIAYTLRNNYTKRIKLIKGGIEFFDLLDTRIYGIRLKEDVRIEPGAEVSSTGNYGMNRFQTDDYRLGEIPPSDVQAKLRITAIIFSDNSKLEPK